MPLSNFIGCITCMNCPINITCTDIKYHCYRASNRYNPAEPLPYFSPSLHKFNREFTPPSEQKLIEACTLGVVHNTTDINRLFCFLLQTLRDVAYEYQCHFASLSHGMQVKKKQLYQEKLFLWHNIPVKEKLVVCTII